jgi:hypothetical protein
MTKQIHIELEPEKIDSLIGVNILNDKEIHEWIAREAYQLAEERKFKNGSPLEDWLEAEKKVTGLLYFKG